MKSILPLPVVGLLTAFLCLSPANDARAQASLAACGDIRVEAQAECTVASGIECTGHCEDLRFEAACAAQLEVECRGQCNASASVSCNTNCQASCEGRCDVDPGRFDCRADCELQANAHCQGECSASGNRAECEASCKATFSAQCDARCEATPPSANCNAKCQASCEGSCRAQANARCQVNCQSNSYAECKAELRGGCRVDCQSSGGVLECDGQYVDYGNNLQNCLNALKSELNITATASGTANCRNGRCEAEGQASASCAMPQGRPSSVGFIALAVAGLGAVMRVRRNRRR